MKINPLSLKVTFGEAGRLLKLLKKQTHKQSHKS